MIRFDLVHIGELARLYWKINRLTNQTMVKGGERFEERSDGCGLFLWYRDGFASPKCRFQYRCAGKTRAIWIGFYAELTLAKARETTKLLSARISLGYDGAGRKRERKADALAKRF